MSASIKNPLDISAVIPTRNRSESLGRLLQSLNDLDYALKEIIIVDSSNNPAENFHFEKKFPKLNFVFLQSVASPCIQRNIGIRKASTPFVFLCDDDIEVPESYASQLVAHIVKYPQINAITGMIYELDQNGNKIPQTPICSFKELFLSFVFQMNIWTDLNETRTNLITKIPFNFIGKYYFKKRKNTFTLAGWPITINTNESCFKTTIYGLGASIVNRKWLLDSPYDELLDSNGIGDNYGVAINFPELQGITVLSDPGVCHHKISKNRLLFPLVYYRRILALHYFMVRSNRFGLINYAFLLWSLIGLFCLTIYKNNYVLSKVIRKAALKIVFNKNPYVLAYRRGVSDPINPQL